ncbi:MAG: TauD/TfdA family dioxygenase [Alphaproteobacteria bacterium]
MKVEKLAGYLGAEVSGIDLNRPPDDATAAFLRRALADHLVLVLRDQTLDLHALKRATEIFGPILRVPYITPSRQDADVIAVLKEAEETNIEVFGGDWHSDFSFLDRPPGGSLLMAVEVPPVGGDTLWSSQVAAYERLPRELREIVDGRKAVHLGAPYGVSHAPPKDMAVTRSIEMTRGDPDADRPRLHPVVRTHPQSGRKALFVNPTYTIAIDGLPDDESKEVLALLFKHALRPDFTFRHRWQSGDLCVWDNRMTMHYAINDYDGHRRLMYRTTFEGEAPSF